MTNEKQRLLTMLDEKKISDSDFKILSAALDKEPSAISKIISIAINPFQKIAGIYALLIGVVILIAMSYAGWYAKIYYTGILNVTNITEIHTPKVSYSVSLLIYQNIVCCLTLSFLYMLFAKIFQQKRLRLIDFFGTVALSRLPFFIVVIYLIIIQRISPDFISHPDIQLHSSWLLALTNLVNMLTALWQLATYFYALKESSGLTGNKLWISAISSLVIATAVSGELTMFFV